MYNLLRKSLPLWGLFLGLVIFFWPVLHSQAASSLPGEKVRACATISSPAIRSGPSIFYLRVDRLFKGKCVDLEGRNAESTWVKIAFYAPQVAVHGWVETASLEIQGNLAGLNVISVPPPTPRNTVAPTPTPGPTVWPQKTSQWYTRQYPNGALAICKDGQVTYNFRQMCDKNGGVFKWLKPPTPTLTLP